MSGMRAEVEALEQALEVEVQRLRQAEREASEIEALLNQEKVRFEALQGRRFGFGGRGGR